MCLNHFQRASNYFATLKVDFPPQNHPGSYSGDDSITHRTEVQKNTKQPVFKTRAFSFKLPPSPSNAFSELLLYPIFYFFHLTPQRSLLY